MKNFPYLKQENGNWTWDFPDDLNMAVQACDYWVSKSPEKVCLKDFTNIDRPILYTYRELRSFADSIAFELTKRGIGFGDRVGVLLSQGIGCAASHIAIWKLGAISIPLFKLFGPDALKMRLNDAQTKCTITDFDGSNGLLPPEFDRLIFNDIENTGEPFKTQSTKADTPAVLIYTSGTTGSPKGALHSQRILTGHIPGVSMSHNYLGHDQDCLWTPADWAWIGGLFDVLMPGLALGVPVVASKMQKFSPKDSLEVIFKGKVRNIFFPPTALRILKASDVKINNLRSVACGGEPLGAEMLEWGKKNLKTTINEFYGQTECNMVVSSCNADKEPISGLMGTPVPGHEVNILDSDGAPTEEEGDIAIKRGSASMMLEYWRRPDQTKEKFKGDWLLTGDRGRCHAGGIEFIGRDDDIINSAGYRIGPSEIEDCLLTHPAVATVGVVGKPDHVRSEIVKAYVVVKAGHKADGHLSEALQEFVKTRLAKHIYPREISFLDELPMTVTGKVIRKKLREKAILECK